MSAPTFKHTDPILHRHADGSEHAHGGATPVGIGHKNSGKSTSGWFGDQPDHLHCHLGLDQGCGPVVWSERDPLPPLAEDEAGR